MKKKTLAMFLAFSLCATFIVPDSEKAANLSVPREVSILDMVADDQPGIDSDNLKRRVHRSRWRIC